MTDLIPFDIEKLKAGYECWTKDGVHKLLKFEILEDRMACIFLNTIRQELWTHAGYMLTGEYPGLINLNLMLKPKTKKLWIAISRSEANGRHITTCCAYEKKEDVEEALRNLKGDEFMIKEIEVEI